MGPQPLSRGNEDRPGRWACRVRLQWGRNLSVAETRWCPPPRLTRLRYFNGAATSQSRKPMRMRRPRPVVEQLQWGRNLSVAETSGRLPELAARRRLQWGRNLSVAETGGRSDMRASPARHFNGAATSQSRKPAGAVATRCGYGTLQWGRNLSVAETRAASCSHRALCPYFNGAATSQSRKRAQQAVLGDDFATLQWGRNLSVAETLIHLARVGQHHATSMGPQPLSRGNRWTGSSLDASSPLQWGRNLSVAETYRRPARYGATASTSMGPQPLSRGNTA